MNVDCDKLNSRGTTKNNLSGIANRPILEIKKRKLWNVLNPKEVKKGGINKRWEKCKTNDKQTLSIITLTVNGLTTQGQKLSDCFF